mmetsp:Transcript_6792/g.5938  ORF Transcript_6792/g.5938 Transcript_6792/m.5938 type:complete len:321 (+) Transcript_6792:21-983(+)
MMKKKKKRPQKAGFSNIEEVTYDGESQANDDELGGQSTQKFNRNEKFITQSLNSQDNFGKMVVRQSLEHSELTSNTMSRPGTTITTAVVNNKATERHYDGKIFCKTLFYSHRFTGVFTYYHDRLPRLHRLLTLYVSVFTALFLSGVFYLSRAEEVNVGGWSYGHSFGFALVVIIFDWSLYLSFTFLFIHKPYPELLLNYLQGGSSDTQTNTNIEGVARPFTSGKSRRFKKPKNDDFELDPKRKKMNRYTTIIACIVCGVFIAFAWMFIIVMGSIFSQEAGHLWGVTFALVLVLDYGLLEVVVYYISSKIVYNKDPTAYGN